VEDVVGYNALGHCFFLEDGNEMENTFVHNLGLLTKAGTLLPSDRNAEMCSGMLDNVYPGYQPNVDEECRSIKKPPAVSPYLCVSLFLSLHLSPCISRYVFVYVSAYVST